MLYPLIIVQQNVEVNVSWAFIYELDPTQVVLDALELIQQCQWLEFRFYLPQALISVHHGEI